MPTLGSTITLRHLPLFIVLVVAAAKASLLLVDAQPRLFMGDSGSYLHAAATSWVPPDRSYAYPLLIRGVTDADGLLHLLWVQTILGLGTALLLYRLLAQAFALDVRIAAALALAFALGPEQLFYERMVMAESASLFALACMLACGFAHVRDGAIGWLVAMAMAGVFAVGFRLSLLPLVLGFSVLPVLGRWLDSPSIAPRTLVRSFLHVVIALAATTLAHSAYKSWYDHRHDRNNEFRDDYIANSGYFRLSLVLPLVRGEDFTDLGIAEGITDGLPPDWNGRNQREALLWGDDTLVSRLRAAHGDPMANRLSRKIAMRAIRRDPIGFLMLGAQTLADYFDPAIAGPRLVDDLGARAPTPATIEEIRREFAFDAEGVATRESPVHSYFRASAPWLVLCLFAIVPIAAVTFATGWRKRRGVAVVLALASLGLFVGHALFSSIVSFRYLHAFPFFIALNLGAIIANVTARRSGARAAVDPQP